MVHQANGLGPFGFTFDLQGHLLVSEAMSGSVSSYAVTDDGNLMLITGSVKDLGMGTCWIVVTKGGEAFVSNTPDGTIASYNVDQSGRVALMSSVAAKVKAPAVDLALTSDDLFLYNLNGGQISGFAVGQGGALTNVATVTGLPSSTTGIAAL
jgi:6-phosphogluconolactonase (cycloisomerase 2 family)